jgi:hypothetical protein
MIKKPRLIACAQMYIIVLSIDATTNIVQNVLSKIGALVIP